MIDVIGFGVAVVTYATLVLGFGSLLSLAAVTLICGEDAKTDSSRGGRP